MKGSSPLREYEYELPDDLVARAPAAPRDSARLFVYEVAADTVRYATVADLALFLPSGAVLACNETVVLPARVALRRERTGGAVTVLFLVNQLNEKTCTVPGFVGRGIPVGERLAFTDGATVEVLSHDGPVFQFRFDMEVDAFTARLKAEGSAPTPPYLGTLPLSREEAIARYQTVFARVGASAAAPTASLHFTPELVASLAAHNHPFVPIRLDVGLGTFAPVTPEQVRTRQLHEERYEISAASAASLAQAKASRRPIVAIGTTTVRALESASPAVLAGTGAVAATNIFIRPPFSFRVTDALMTNFHLPGSSLMALVDAFLEYRGARRRIVELYRIAIDERFRFFSFGDAMLIV